MEVLPFLAAIWPFASAHFFGALTPGPDFFRIMDTTLTTSRGKGVLTALGSTCGSLIHMTYIALGLNFLKKSSPNVYAGIKILGAIYLFYLGFRALQARPQKKSDLSEKAKDIVPMTPFMAWRRGFFTNLLNPMCIIYFLALFSSLMQNAVLQKYIQFACGSLLMVSFFCFSMLAFVFAQKHIRAMFQRLGHWVDWIAGLILIGLGVKTLLGTILAYTQ